MRSLAACLLACTLALLPRDHRDDRIGDGGESGIVTLHARDDLSSSFDFRSGGPGGRVVDGEVRLDGAQIAFDVFARGMLSFGFSLDERVHVLDLGPVQVPPAARARDRAAELPMSLFHTLFKDDNGFAFVGPGGDVDPYERADKILTTPLTHELRHLEPIPGHTYLVRVLRNGTKVDELFKFVVIGLVPDHSLTLRWGRLSG
jgi:hypothetical protein